MLTSSGCCVTITVTVTLNQYDLCVYGPWSGITSGNRISPHPCFHVFQRVEFSSLHQISLVLSLITYPAWTTLCDVTKVSLFST